MIREQNLNSKFSQRNSAIPTASITSMDRLEYIFKKDPEWALQRAEPGSAIAEFLCENPEFKSYLKYVALTRKAEIPKELKTIKDMLKYYVSFAGVNANYGSKVYQLAMKGEYSTLTEKKRLILQEIDQLPEITTMEAFEKINIKGVGEGAKSFVQQHYFNDVNMSYPTDRIFQKGLAKIYGRESITISQAKTLISQWKGQKSVGSMFCFQVANYAK